MSAKTRDTLFVVCLFLMALMAGFRDQGGNDWLVYEGIYQRSLTFPSVLSLRAVDSNYEMGYVYFVAFFKTLGLSFYGYVLINALLFYICLWKGLRRYTDHFGFVIIVFLYKLFYYNTFISMRQSVSIALFFLMIPLLENRRIVPYMLLSFLASRFHNGAYLLFLLYPVTYLNLTKNGLVLLNVIFIPTLAISLSGIDVLGPIGSFLESYAETDAEFSKIDRYFYDENLTPIGIFHTVEYFSLMLLLIANYNDIRSASPHSKLFINLFVCLLPLFTLLRGSEVLTREKDYFTISYAFILAMMLHLDQGRHKTMIIIATVAICSFGFIRFVSLFDGGVFLHYQSWLSNPAASLFLR